MSAARNRQAYAFVALPVILSVVLVALCLPVACASAAPIQKSCDMETAPAAEHGPMPAHHEGSGEACKHTSVPAQAVASSQQLLVDQVIAPALAVDATTVLPVAPVAEPLAEGASPPTGVLLTASQLRI